MKILFWGSIIFYLAFTLHLIIWKIHIPKNQTKMLLQIFFGMLIISFIILWNTVYLSITEYLHIALLFISLTLAYLTTYSCIEVDSPTLVMVLNIAKTSSKGLEKEKLEQIMNDAFLIKPRVKDLVEDKMVYQEDNKYKLTSRGFLLARIFIFYRRLLNAEKGG